MEKLVEVTLFETTDGPIYRIPALIYLKESKTFLAFAEKRDSLDDHSAKALVMKRGMTKSDGSVEWSSCQELGSASCPEHRAMCPCPVYDENTKTIFLFFICIYQQIHEQWQIRTGINMARLRYISSKDDGQNWSEKATDITHYVTRQSNAIWATFAVGPGHGIQLKSGRLLIPAYAYYFNESPCTPYALSIYSDDNGATWKLGEKLADESVECEMAEIIDSGVSKGVYCNTRTTGRLRCEALSTDGGINFVPLATKTLIETGRGCQGSVIAFTPPEKYLRESDGGGGADATPTGLQNAKTWLLFSHPTDCHKRKNLGVFANRTPLELSGWSEPRIICTGPSAYSDLAYREDSEDVACLLERGTGSQMKIVFVTFPLKDLLGPHDEED